ncbi:hypothetical protein BWI15_20390 [Kribbella sp. ALI-6-A]|uniref:hypothetical protein n=1 Tax=Kribbella sp. ALI-6-A TaxID=1933817 RepID=UPI00097CA254|nr:hypothetical protein [Kribbella sp. ALI-6-A]ONI72397.1 hypothetical protein BWI15_20390 [Kribbella sp. ALI-6-A]
MLKRTLALTLLLTSQALPAPAAPTAIGPVTIAWADATHKLIKITWTETTPTANTLALESDAEEIPEFQFGTTTAAQPNEYLVEATRFSHMVDPAGRSRFVVAGGGTQARSADFDQYLYDERDLRLAFAGDKLRWTLPADNSVDGTPGDPLDLPKAYTYTAVQRVDADPVGTYECRDLSFVSAVPTGELPNRGQAYDLTVKVANEWGQRANLWATVGSTKNVTTYGPGSSPYGGTTTLTGHVNGTSMFQQGSPPVCEEFHGPTSNQAVVVQQRTSLDAPWTVVGTTRTNDQGNYTAVFRNPGHREYRVVRPNVVNGTAAAYGKEGYPVSVRATTRVVSAKFIQPTVTLGTQPQAYLWVDPAGPQKAALQFKNAAGAWQGVAYKTLYAGRGILTFPWNKRGTTQFRWWVPASPSADATYSGVFTLTVR